MTPLDDPRHAPRSTGERARWASAVLIVAAIGATSVGVHMWPVAPRQAAPPARPAAFLPSRSLPLLHAPVPPARVPVRVPGSVARAHVSGPVPPPPVAPLTSAAAPAAVERANAGPAAQPTGPAVEIVPVLASRRVDVGTRAHGRVEADAAVDAPSPSHPFVELPVVAVTRAVTVAGRGIRTGLRATSAALRAAF